MTRTASALAALLVAAPALAQAPTPGYGPDPILPKLDTDHRVPRRSARRGRCR